MARGGARNRSGPTPDPNSGRSDRRGYKVTALPAQGYDGPVPPWPLSSDGDAHWRELEVWADLWRTPQACAWSLPSESWRVRTVAMYCRVLVRCEAPNASPPLLGQLHRFADQIGMTTAGLAEMGWAVAVDEVGAKRAEREDEAPAAKASSSRDRMRLASGGR